MALGSFDVYKPSPAAQRRLARILREIDPHAVEKLLLWESVHREAAAAEQGGDPSKLNRLRMRVAARVKELDKQAVSRDGRLGGGGGKRGTGCCIIAFSGLAVTWQGVCPLQLHQHNTLSWHCYPLAPIYPGLK
jgi:hypothetical protein